MKYLTNELLLIYFVYDQGLRAPFLQIGSNRQFLMMSEFGFVYDSSIVAPFSDPPIWPYTLDYKPSHSCTFQSCPTRAHPGIWELPLNEIRVGVRILDKYEICKIYSFGISLS